MKHQVILSIFVASGLIAFSQAASSQETAEIPPPKFPIKLRANENAQWTIDIRKKGGRDSSNSNEAEEQKRPSQIVLTKTGPIYREEANGATQWIFVTDGGIYRLNKPPGSQNWERVENSVYLDAQNYSDSDFESFNWIGEKNYKGVQVLDNVPVYYFEETSHLPITRQDELHYDVGSAMSGDASYEFVAKAWLDAKTLLPVRFEDNRQVQTYTFGAAPNGRLSPPAEVLAALKKWVEDVKRMNR